MNDKRFLELAALVAGWSKDPSTKCGAVIVDHQRRIISTGYNGFPAGIPDNPEHYTDRAEKYPRVIHAEKNAILFARRDLTGCTLYVWPMQPCSQCAAFIVQSGINRVVTVRHTDEQEARWGDGFKIARDILGERLEILIDVRENKS